jgi:hypothetical protein
MSVNYELGGIYKETVMTLDIKESDKNLRET